MAKHFKLEYVRNIYDLRFEVIRYSNGAPCVRLMESSNEIFATLSADLAELPQPECMWLKSWDENRKLVRALSKFNFFKRTSTYGYLNKIEVRQVRFTPKFYEYSWPSEEEARRKDELRFDITRGDLIA